MIDLFCIFTTGGLILWSKSFVSFDFSSILNDLIKTILMDEKKTQDFYIPSKGNGIILRWKIFNKSGIIFVVAYQQSFNLLYTDKLLDIVMSDFIKERLPTLKHENNIFYKLTEEKDYNQKFIELLNAWEGYCKNKVNKIEPKKTEKTFKEKNQESPDNINNNNTLSNSAINISKSTSSKSPSHSKGLSSSQNFYLRKKKQEYNNSSSKKKDNKKNNKNKKEARIWNEIGKVDKKSMETLDQSEEKGKAIDLSKSKSQEYFNSQVLGKDEKENPLFNEKNFDELQEDEHKPTGIFSKLTSALKNYIGNKVLTKEDLKPAMDQLINLLMEKNVAKEIAENLCESVKKGLLNTKTNSFTTI